MDREFKTFIDSVPVKTFPLCIRRQELFKNQKYKRDTEKNIIFLILNKKILTTLLIQKNQSKITVSAKAGSTSSVTMTKLSSSSIENAAHSNYNEIILTTKTFFY